jgi:hypothetical protein
VELATGLELGAGPPTCLEDIDIVGYRYCTPYGVWGRSLREPYTFVTVGVNHRRLRAATGRRSPVSLRATATSGADPGAMTDAVTFSERLGFALPRRLYVAFEFELGNLIAFDDPTASPDIVLASTAALGLRGGLGPGAIALEVAGGALAQSYATDGRLRGEPLVEARARADLWITPWFSFGGTVGTSLLDRDLWTAGLHLGFHSHAYAGDRGLP